MASFNSSASTKPRNLSPFRFRKPSLQEKIPSFTSSRAPSGRSLTPRSNSPAFRFSSASSVDSSSPVLDSMDSPTAKENVSVTVRLRPLSPREIYKGDQAAWYADGDTLVRSEYNPSTAYAYDRVFGPATTTRGVYDVAACHVVRGAMEGVNGTVFAYGVTSSGKTHTMHGDQKSPGIIPLAIKDVFNIIQDTVGRDFLLRVSYLEIYNEVINDLLDPTGQNLRVREDAQGTYVEGIKEEVVLSPAHALSLIAAGEEHRHVGSNNINLQSSRSHTIFNLTIESSAHGDSFDEVTLSQLNLIDLAGSESSKSETTGLRRKEGTYINKSLLTLGTVISKLSDGKSSHIPYRDSKLTRLLQSSLSGHGRVSLICTITPASSNMEETHNTLKFAHRAKRVELHTAPIRIIDDKSLIKKYQKQICSLKQELEQVKRGTLVSSSQEDIVTLKEKLEAGQVRLQSRLEEEEQAKAALMGRIQRLTKLILVSTKNTIPVNFPERPAYRRRHSFGEDELAYLPSKKRDLITDNDDDSGLTGKDAVFSADGKGVRNSADDILKDEKKNKKRGMLSWFKMRKQDALIGSPVACPENENFPNGSPPASAGSSTHSDLVNEFKSVHQKSSNKRMDELSPVIDSFPGPTQAGELFSVTSCGWKPPPTGTTIADQMDLLKEQVKMLAGEVAFCSSSLKRLSEQVSNNPDDTPSKVQMLKMEEEIEEKKQQMRILKQRMIGIGEASANGTSLSDLQQVIANLMSQLDEKTFELEIMSADNRILQEQFQAKTDENEEAQGAILLLRQQLASALERHSYQSRIADNVTVESAEAEMYANVGARTELVAEEDSRGSCEELRGQMLLQTDENEEAQGAILLLRQQLASTLERHSYQSRIADNGTVESAEAEMYANVGARTELVAEEDSRGSCEELRGQMLLQAAEIEKLKQDKVQLIEEKGGLQIQGQKLAEEATYAKELASAAAVELKILAEEVSRLSFQNAKLAKELETAQDMAFSRPSKLALSNGLCKYSDSKMEQIQILKNLRISGGPEFESDIIDDIDSWNLDSEDIKRELRARKEREAALEAILVGKEQAEAELQKKIDEYRKKEADLENDLAGMWVLVANLRKESEVSTDVAVDDDVKQDMQIINNDDPLNIQGDENNIKEWEKDKETIEELTSCLENEKRQSTELDRLIAQLKSEDLEGLDAPALEDLQSLHVEALTKLSQVKAQMQENFEKENECDSLGTICKGKTDDHICRVCFQTPTAAILLPCLHFCTCKPCAEACTECPLCKTKIADRIITVTS